MIGVNSTIHRDIILSPSIGTQHPAIFSSPINSLRYKMYNYLFAAICMLHCEHPTFQTIIQVNSETMPKLPALCDDIDCMFSLILLLLLLASDLANQVALQSRDRD